MNDPLDSVREKLELIKEGSLRASELAAEALVELDAMSPCPWCEGKGYEVHTFSDPDNCGNCAYGDCDYGHDRKEVCDSCSGTGRSAGKV